jgi:hypothetical protein
MIHKKAHATAEIGEKIMIPKTNSVAAPAPPKKKEIGAQCPLLFAL